MLHSDIQKLSFSSSYWNKRSSILQSDTLKSSISTRRNYTVFAPQIANWIIFSLAFSLILIILHLDGVVQPTYIYHMLDFFQQTLPDNLYVATMLSTAGLWNSHHLSHGYAIYHWHFLLYLLYHLSCKTHFATLFLCHFFLMPIFFGVELFLPIWNHRLDASLLSQIW